MVELDRGKGKKRCADEWRGVSVSFCGLQTDGECLCGSEIVQKAPSLLGSRSPWMNHNNSFFNTLLSESISRIFLAMSFFDSFGLITLSAILNQPITDVTREAPFIQIGLNEIRKGIEADHFFGSCISDLPII